MNDIKYYRINYEILRLGDIKTGPDESSLTVERNGVQFSDHGIKIIFVPTRDWFEIEYLVDNQLYSITNRRGSLEAEQKKLSIYPSFLCTHEGFEWAKQFFVPITPIESTSIEYGLM